MNRLPTWQKLALLAIPCMLLAAVPAVLYLRELHARAPQAELAAAVARFTTGAEGLPAEEAETAPRQAVKRLEVTAVGY